MIGYRIKGKTTVYTNYDRFVHVLKTRHADKKIDIEVFDILDTDLVDKELFLKRDRRYYNYDDTF